MLLARGLLAIGSANELPDAVVEMEDEYEAGIGRHPGCCFASLPSPCRQLRKLPVPYLSGRIVDQAAILSEPARERIVVMLQAHERVYRQPDRRPDHRPHRGRKAWRISLCGYSRSWKLGSREKDNGVLILVVPQDRRMRIEVGYGLEGTLTDAAASRMIRDLMTPRFREGNYDVGIEAGVTGVIQILEDRQPTDPESDWAAPANSAAGFHVEAPDMPIAERILISLFVFGIIGLFTFIGLVTPGGMGWFLYVFLIPFWSMFPMAIFGSSAALGIVGIYGIALSTHQAVRHRACPGIARRAKTSRPRALPISVA